MEKVPTDKAESLESKEPIPTEEEVRQVFEQLTDKPFEEVRKLNDGEGQYLWEVKFPDADPENMGGYVQYQYLREGSYEEGGAVKTGVVATFYSESETLIGGDDLAEFVDGYWKLKNN